MVKRNASPADVERFLDKVVKSASGCWEWHSGKYPNGYGKFKLHGKTVGAHRVSFEMFVGLIPKRKNVCHSCDNPGCVRPSHLFAGTHIDNMDDRGAKKRQAKGEGQGLSKLTEADVREIRRASGSHKHLATKYGVDPSTLRAARLGKNWRHIPL